MRKILLLACSLLFLILAFTKTSFAQAPTTEVQNYFDTTKQAANVFLSKGSTAAQTINLPPFTNIIIDPGTFAGNTNVIVFKGNFDNIKTLIPAAQTPISSYFVVFFDSSKGNSVSALKPLHIISYVNYVKKTAFFYPLNSSFKIDSANQKQTPSPVKLTVDLPLNDSAFIVSSSIVLAKNDMSLNPAVLKGNPSPTIAGNTNKTGLVIGNDIKIIGAVLLIVIASIAIIFLLFKK